MKEKSFHKTIFKNTGLFGFSQVLKILVRVVTNKFAAIFLGVTGIGVIGFLENILTLIRSVTDVGMTQSSVREVALSKENFQSQRLLQILYRWSWISGLIGTAVMTLFASQFSLLVFDDESYALWFVLLSLYFLFTSVSAIRLAVLRGKNKVITIVKYEIVGAVITSLLAIPLYYFFGIKGIIPVFLITSLIGFLASLYFTRDIQILQSKVPLKDFMKEVSPMVKLGFLLSMNMVFWQLSTYVIRWFLKDTASIETLGIYQVSNTFLVSYLGLIFTTMSNDYYPRLCNYQEDEKSFTNLVNDQTELALFLVVPAILLLYLIVPTLIPLLYSSEFLEVLSILQIGLFSVILKTVVWSIGYIPLVKGNKKMFFKQTVFGDVLNMLLSIVLFYYYGLQGLGIAITTMFVISGIYTYQGVSRVYGFKFRADTKKVISMSLLFGIIGTFSVFLFGFTWKNPVLIFVLFISIGYSIWHLRNKL